MEISVVAVQPPIVVVDDFASDDEIACALALFDDGVRQADPGAVALYDGSQSVAGISCEIRVDAHPVLGPLAGRMSSILGAATSMPPSLRFRHYRPGDHHPPHGDHFEIGGAALATTAMLCLDTPESGGATRFCAAMPNPVRVSPRRGRLVTWFNVSDDGDDDPLSVHESLPLLAGSKRTVTLFSYRPRDCPELLAARRRWS